MMHDDAIDLSHLKDRVIRYDVPADLKKGIPARSYAVDVSFSEHCYTRGDSSGQRVFDQRRYELSKLLPSIIAGLLSRRISFAPIDQRVVNYLTLEGVSEGEDYEVYFDVFKRKGTRTLGLIVRSAYVRDRARLAERPKSKTVKFSTILYGVMNGKKLHP